MKRVRRGGRDVDGWRGGRGKALSAYSAGGTVECRTKMIDLMGKKGREAG